MASIKTKERDYFIDFGKGIACLLMAYGHTVYHTVYYDRPEPSYSFFWLTAEFAIPLFFMASGYNVVSQVQRMRADTSWRPMTAYLLSMVWLFALGFVYNLGRHNLGLMELFHAVAMGTALVFIATRREWPTWAMVGLALGFFALSSVLTYDVPEITTAMIKSHPVPDKLNEFKILQYISLIQREAVMQFPLWRRLLYIHFAFVPWAGLFLLGAVAKRVYRTKGELFLWILAIVLFVVPLLLMPYRIANDDADFFMRGKADYCGRLLIVGMLFMMPLQRWYRTGPGFRKAVEEMGKESFVFFVVHWIVLWISAMVFTIFHRIIPLSPFVYWVVQMPLNLYFSYRLTMYFANLRDRTYGKPGYAKKWFVILAVSSGVSLMLGETERTLAMLVLKVASLVAAVAMAMVWPVGRNFIQGMIYRKPRRPKAKPAEAAAAPKE